MSERTFHAPGGAFPEDAAAFHQAAESETACVGFAVRIDALIRSPSSLTLFEMEMKRIEQEREWPSALSQPEESLPVSRKA